MLLVKFKKVDSFAFCSYLNCRDAIVQTIKRANIQVEYSQGFNPHELLYFSPPTSLGIESECEYFTIYTNDIFDFAGRFNANAPSGLQVIWTKEMNTRPDFYNLIDYEFWLIIADRPVDINLYISQLQLQLNNTQSPVYRKLIMDDISKAEMFMNNGIVDTEYFILFKEKDNDAIQKKIRNLINNLANCGLIASQTSNEDLRTILDNFLNGGAKFQSGTVIANGD